VTDEESRLVAEAASTCMVPRGQKASGRQSCSTLAERSAQPACQPTGFRAPLENLAICPTLLVKNTSRRAATELSLLSSDWGDGARTRKRQMHSTGGGQVGSHEVRAIAVRGLSSAPSLVHVEIALVV
jgi:hypothetical protein